MTMQELIREHGRDTIEIIIRDLQGEQVLCYGMLPSLHQEILETLNIGNQVQWYSIDGWCVRTTVLLKTLTYRIHPSYTLPSAVPEPKVFWGELKPRGRSLMYSTPLGKLPWEQCYRLEGWRFLGFFKEKSNERVGCTSPFGREKDCLSCTVLYWAKWEKDGE